MKKAHVAVLLGRRIRSLRRAEGFTQEELGAACKISYKHLGAIERGEENPSLVVLEKIAYGLDMDISELFRFHHEETDPAKLRKMATDLIEEIRDEPVEKLQLILRILRALR